MSYDRIAELLTYAQQAETEADNTPGHAALTLRRHAYRQRAAADRIAVDTRPPVHHPVHGPGTILGVHPDGTVEVVFGGTPMMVAVSELTDPW